LHPALERGVRELMRRMAVAGFPHVGVSSTYRDNVHQDWLFAQGRTRPGNIVTNARGGQSIHNYRLAFDIFQNIRGQEWNNPRFFEAAGRIWQEMGGVWGGNWINFVDRPHFEYTHGLTLRDLQNGRVVPMDARMEWESGVHVSCDRYGEYDSCNLEVLEMRFNTITDMPEWARATIKQLVELGLLKGDEQGNLNLSQDMLRLLVINDRAGLYG